MDADVFPNMNDVRELTESWMMDYNENCPHYSLGGMSSNEYRREYERKNVTLAVKLNAVRKKMNEHNYMLSMVKAIEDVKLFAFQLVNEEDLSFHPDDDFSDYINLETKEPLYSDENANIKIN